MDETLSLPPFLPLLIGGLLLVFLPLYGRRAVMILAPLASLAAVFNLNPESVFPLNIAGTTVQLLSIQTYSLVFGFAFCLAIFAATLFGFKQAKPKEIAAAFIVASGGLGIVFAGDLLSLLFFWEVLMGASVYLIYLGGLTQSQSSARRYLVMHILGGTLLLAGIAGTIMDSGIAAFPSYQVSWSWPQSATEWSAWMMLLGVMVNLAAPPFSAWLPDSYPAASPFGMLVLSAFTTKSAVLVLIQIFAGSTPLIIIGIAMLIYGALMALMQNHLRRHLAYCIIAQVGVMVMAIGIGNEVALTGVVILAFCHIGYKGLLISAAGSIIRQTGKYRLSDLGGLWRQMPVTAGAILLGAISMAALPITGAYIGKHLIAESLSNIDHPVLALLFIGGTGIAVYMLFPWFALFGKSNHPKTTEVKLEVQLCYGIFGFMALAPGIFPNFLNFMIPQRPELMGYALSPVLSQLLLIGSACAAFVIMLPLLRRNKGIILDIDFLYRVFFPYLLNLLNRFYGTAESRISSLRALSNKVLTNRFLKLFSEYGTLTRPQPLSFSTALITGLLLLLLLVFYR